MSKHPSRFSFRFGLFRGAHKLWNCLAFHIVVDDSQRTMTLTLGLPALFTWIIETPLIPTWLGSRWLSGGEGERAEYGLWHDYHETKLQWRRIINLGGMRGGWEFRAIHDHGPEGKIFRHETILTAWVADIAQPWVEANHVDRWKLVLSTWRAPSEHWWIPTLYDRCFILHAFRADGINHEATVKGHISKRLTAEQVFNDLTKQITFE